MAYIIVRGAERQGGFVSMVEKKRVKGSVRTVAYICGLGNMTMGEFKTFQKWAHSLKPQEYRKQMVLSSGRAITEKEGVPKRIAETKASLKAQRKEGVKKDTKTRVKAPKKTVRKHYPVPAMVGYKGTERGMTHTQIMMEKEIGRQKIRGQAEVKAKYKAMPTKEREARIKELDVKRRKWKKEYRHWDVIVSEGGLYSAKKERAHRVKAEQKISAIDEETKRLREWR